MTTTADLNRQVLAVQRTIVIVLAVVAIALGVIAIVWPVRTQSAIAFLFGVFLVVSGVQRIAATGAARKSLTTAGFTIGLVVGAIVVACGILSLSNAMQSLALLAFVIGFGWMLTGAADIYVAISSRATGLRWVVLLAGVLSLLAGGALIFSPGFSVPVFMTVGAVLLIVIGIGVLLTFPRAIDARAKAIAG